ncbi:hypothetical protein [Stackebrandtia soli]|uniref:hypothetical protein n=1 Tax=Stackebrandtia soli TaxID=1892856 RepID=UPI0039E770FF
MGITDISVAGKCVQEVDAIEYINDSQIDTAVQALVAAAEDARKNEGPDDPDVGAREHVESVPGSYDWIPERFERFKYRWPTFPRSMAEHLGEARRQIDSGQLSDIDSVNTAVARWTGRTRDAFYENFLSPFPDAVTRQQALFVELQSALYAYEAALRQSRQLAKKITEETIKALEASGGVFGTSAEEGKLAIAVAAAVAGVIGAAATGGGSLGVTFAIIGGVGGTAPAVVDLVNAEEKPKTIKGDTVAGILESMQSALDDLWEDMRKAEKGIAGYLTATIEEVNGYIKSGDKKVKRTLLPHEPDDKTPDLTDADNDDDVSVDPGTGDFRVREPA